MIAAIRDGLPVPRRCRDSAGGAGAALRRTVLAGAALAVTGRFLLRPRRLGGTG